jgi:predicted metal-dependent hydrolase
MEFDWNHGELAEGLGCYRREEFFNAHEHWEVLWRQSRGPDKPFLQALIQMAGGFYHWKRGNRRGAYGLLWAAQGRLAAFEPSYAGVKVAAIRKELSRWLEALAGRNLPIPASYPEIGFGRRPAKGLPEERRRQS